MYDLKPVFFNRTDGLGFAGYRPEWLGSVWSIATVAAPACDRGNTTADSDKSLRVKSCRRSAGPLAHQANTDRPHPESYYNLNTTSQRCLGLR